ncbi:MAG: hypothetical protein ACYC3X_16915 [Pirellulaceae bacterium]
MGRFLLGTLLALWGADRCAVRAASAQTPSVDQDVAAAVEADWAAQESRAGREPGSPESIDAALQRGQQLLASLVRITDAAALEPHERTLRELGAAVDRLTTLNHEQRLTLYLRLRWAGRQLALSNPLWAGKPVVFVQRKRFICQMLHEYIGYYYNYADLAGGGVFVLPRPGYSFATQDLIDGRLPRGAYTTPALSYDGATVYFAFAPMRAVERKHPLGVDWTILPAADKVPQELNYFSPDRVAFHNAPFYGTYREETRSRQLAGETIDPPLLQ